MTPLAAIFDTPAGRVASGQVAAAVVLGTLGFYFLLPRPRGRSVALGTFLAIASAVATGAFLYTAFGKPAGDIVGQVLFWLFSGGAVLFGGILVTQKNPARGAMAFAFVILSSCGLFLLLAAPFLMAATIIIYAGAIIVTFLFVLMLSHAGGPSDENDRSREPLLGSLGGLAFAGLVLFTLYLSSPAAADAGESPVDGFPLPSAPPGMTDKAILREIATELDRAAKSGTKDELLGRDFNAKTRDRLALIGTSSAEAGQSIPADVARPTRAVPFPPTTAKQTQALKIKSQQTFDDIENLLLGPNPDLNAAHDQLLVLRNDVLRLAGRGDLPARNVAAIGYALYSEHLLAVEMAGTLLLVATIGAVAIAHRKQGGAA
ncbi:NADH-quinone oxidoreductase subunit J [Fimbriiglobus ruber]|uniref:NADH-quinone oxidoreductase subunit J n=1 Tax=Fimbriiglobus ruber TaxID=1908690 RepID=A0A225DSY8_9BACT|nr:NADH-quinone oxidoreductase subunit J [Fimbriiglobus ruber]OWK41658.1 NADH-ubiquinone oxidoreductase chain J [Fimbriiglobus ruber]